MKFDPDKHHRRSIRLKHFDYTTAGAYFVTICAHNKECLFGEIVDGSMELNEFGEIIQQVWKDLPNHYFNVDLDYFVIMPNHVHGIIRLKPIDETVRAGYKSAATKDVLLLI